MSLSLRSTQSLAFAAVLGAILTFGATSVAAQAQPKAALKTAVHDFGPISRGAKVSTSFEIENQGDAPLEITEVRVACACTVVDYPEVLAPGESGKITVELDSTSVDGPTTQRMQVFTNDPKAPRLDLAVKADSRPLIRAEPGYVRYVTVKGFDAEKNDPTLREDDRRIRRVRRQDLEELSACYRT